MGFLYKKSFTTSQFLTIDPKKVLRVYGIVLLIAAVSTFFLSWYTTHVLANSEIPDDSSMRYHDTKSIMIFFINLFFMALMVFANLYSQTAKKIAPLPYLLTWGFYSVFVLLDAYYISDHFSFWQQSLHLLKGELPEGHTTGWMKTGLAFIVTSFNAVMIWWGLRK